LARSLGVTSCRLFRPHWEVVIDESIYAYEGSHCPVRRYIPRKPHPNGLLNYAVADTISVAGQELPYILDMEPIVPGNEPSAQEAMMTLFGRLRERFPQMTPHLVVDSAFGSFDRLDEIMQNHGNATMSMSPVVTRWLWELLNWDCGVDEGRAAFTADRRVVVGSYQVISEAGNWHQIKFISSGFPPVREPAGEEVVEAVLDRRERGGMIEYYTRFADGTTKWLLPSQFIDEDGTCNLSWLNFVSKEDLEQAFSSYTLTELKVLIPFLLLIYYII
jgi:hypothetical protein